MKNRKKMERQTLKHLPKCLFFSLLDAEFKQEAIYAFSSVKSLGQVKQKKYNTALSFVLEAGFILFHYLVSVLSIY
jgi:hypothetical protein